MGYNYKIRIWNDINIGDTIDFTKTITVTDVTLWVGITGDMNPVYIDKIFGKSTRFGNCIVPSVLVQGLISTAITQLLSGNVYTAQSIKFIKPVFIGDTVTASAMVVEKNEYKNTIKVETKCINQKGELVLIGEGVEYILS